MLDAVNDRAVGAAENNVTVFSHQFHDQCFLAQITHFIEVLDIKTNDTFHVRLVIFMIRPFAMCLRNSIQKFGAVSGLGLFVSVRYRKGSEALADMARRNCPLLPFKVKRSSSFSGWAILLIFAFKIV